MTPLTAEERTALQTELRQLETAYTEMITGARLTSVAAPGGRSMGFGQGNPTAVRARIAEIKRKLGLGGGRVSIRPFF